MPSTLLLLAWQSPALFVSPPRMAKGSHIDTTLLSPTCCSCICCSGVLFHQITLHLLGASPGNSNLPHILWGQEQGAFTLLCLPPSCLAAQPSPAPGCAHCCVLTYPLLQERSCTQGHPRPFPHPSLSPLFLLSSEPFPSSPLLVQLLAVKILALLMSWMWLLSCKAAF